MIYWEVIFLVEQWERQKGESSKYFQWFKVFRDLGGQRNLAEVIKEIETNDEILLPVPTLSQVKTASAKWQWIKRCRRYDNYLDKLAREQKEKEYFQLEDRLIDVGNQLVDVIEKNIENLHDNFEDSKSTSVAHAIASDAKAFDSTVKNVRLLYGRSTEIKDESVSASVDVESDTNLKIDILDQQFMENELDYMIEMIQKREANR